jgi:putative DNA-invertase from lambdoid prophage Rac
MRAACYLRVSTTQQDVSNQLPAIEAWCESRGYELAEVYQESESAWRNGHQHELSRLLSDIRGGKRRYEVLLCWALDRLSRQGIGPLLQLINTFELYGCHVISITESWTQPEAGPMREMFIAISAWAAKFESDRRSERTRAGLDTARAKGKRLGRPPGRKDSKKRIKKRPVIFRYGEVSVNAINQ